ncbi:MAG TPA: hypothetical protein VF994_01050 [Myxococcales bacterium]
MNPLRSIAAVIAIVACAPQPPPRPRPEIVLGEALVHTANAALLTTERLSAATGRDDFIVKEVHCLLGTCRVVFERAGAAVDSAWTYELVDALAVARMPGIDGVETNPVVRPR